MNMKKQYNAPRIEVIRIGNTYGVMETLSLPISSNAATGGGDAKGGFFDDVEDEEIENNRPWGDISY